MRAALDKVSLAQKLSLFSDHWSPKVVAEVNDFHVKLVKLSGEFVWHSHDAEDELFLVIRGRLRMLLRDRTIDVDPGEFIVIPRGTEHCPAAEEEVHLLLLEPKTTVNTGTAGGDRTKEATWL
jgi:mannose-6-phosphate isomerase-like protein (cupin superfamily)